MVEQLAVTPSLVRYNISNGYREKEVRRQSPVFD